MVSTDLGVNSATGEIKPIQPGETAAAKSIDRHGSAHALTYGSQVGLCHICSNPLRVDDGEGKCRLLRRGDFAGLHDARSHHRVERRKQISVLELLLQQRELCLIGAQLRLALCDILLARSLKLERERFSIDRQSASEVSSAVLAESKSWRLTARPEEFSDKEVSRAYCARAFSASAAAASTLARACAISSGRLPWCSRSTACCCAARSASARATCGASRRVSSRASSWPCLT